MTKRAIERFRAQTYDPTRRSLVILDTGADRSFVLSGSDSENEVHDWRPSQWNRTIGSLRNYANAYAGKAEIIAHWDDDDWSHPERLSEQVALLQASGKEAVGYREMLFWRTVQCVRHGLVSCPDCTDRGLDGEAWLYSNGNPNYTLGTSLMYWRSTWERRPFEDLAHGEDDAWRRGVDCLGVATIREPNAPELEPLHRIELATGNPLYAPRMIATIHGGNTSPAYNYLEACEKQGEKWKRVPQWDDYCRRTLA